MSTRHVVTMWRRDYSREWHAECICGATADSWSREQVVAEMADCRRLQTTERSKR